MTLTATCRVAAMAATSRLVWAASGSDDGVLADDA